ncbi:hypothetical protein HLB23_28920 [Nocardia uniformis]|uniref:Uncharacterized protein n=1 Tax=Nocardia uniformis TaxID=53432 RepID=A0A849CEL9_9NOCA|nr:hypothetical protein [Nocardia uniformis]NNH73829.1 hypothetical protein [Nocardia uniformis]
MNTPTQPDPSESLRAIRTLVQAQDLRTAKQQLRQLQSGADDPTWAMIVEIANTLRFKTHAVALTKLRKLWRDNEQFRPLIEACVPKANERQHIPPNTPAQSFAATGDRTNATRASKVKTRTEPDRRVEPGRRVRNPNAKVVDDYEKALARDERDEPGTPRSEPIIDRHDYDIDVLTHVATTLCVSCRLERAAIDRHTERVQDGHGDDGLCGECRSLGRPGLPELPSGHTLADQVHARLDYLAEHFTAEDRGIFRQEWRYADRHARPIISAWVKANTTAGPEPAPLTAESSTLNDWCTQCGEYRYIAHTAADEVTKLCIDCDPRNQQTLVPAGSIEVRHNQYDREIRDTASQVDAVRVADSVSGRGGQKERPRPRETSKGAAVGQLSPTKSPAPKPQTTGANTPFEKARVVAQERRRAIGRSTGGGIVAKRSIRR